jgi:hypothetical protein
MPITRFHSVNSVLSGVRQRADAFRFHSYDCMFDRPLENIGSERMASPETPTPVPALTLPHWQLEYESALRETDHKILFKKVEIAEAALLNQREILDRPADAFQRTEVEIALSKLRLLKKGILNF